MYQFRSASKSDLAAIVRLRESVEGGNSYFERSERYYNWKYFQNPCGDSIVKVALTEKGEMVGLMSANYKLFSNQGKMMKALEWGDFFTHEGHQRKGIFSGLCRSVLDEIKDENIHFSYIRPNNNSYPIVTNKLGFSDIDELEERFYFIDSKKLLRNRFGKKLNKLAAPLLNLLLSIVHKRPKSTNPSVLEIDEDRFDQLQLSKKLRAELIIGGFKMVKDDDYLKWRFFSSPIPVKCFGRVSDQKITDYIMVAFDKSDGAYLVDFMTTTSGSGVMLMDATLNNLRMQQKKFVSAYVRISNQKSDELCSLMIKYRFIKVGKNLHFVKKLHKADSVLHLDQWQFRLADIDGI